MDIWVDIDHTICDYDEDTLDYTKAKPNFQRIDIVNSLYMKGHRITMWTARGTKTGINWYDTTKKQLDSWGLMYHELLMGKPAFDILVDDKALTRLEQLYHMTK